MTHAAERGAQMGAGVLPQRAAAPTAPSEGVGGERVSPPHALLAPMLRVSPQDTTVSACNDAPSFHTCTQRSRARKKPSRQPQLGDVKKCREVLTGGTWLPAASRAAGTVGEEVPYLKPRCERGEKRADGQ